MPDSSTTKGGRCIEATHEGSSPLALPARMNSRMRPSTHSWFVNESKLW